MTEFWGSANPCLKVETWGTQARLDGVRARVVQPGADSAVVTAGVIGVQREAEGSVIAASGCDVLAGGVEGHRERGAECERENDDYRETED